MIVCEFSTDKVEMVTQSSINDNMNSQIIQVFNFRLSYNPVKNLTDVYYKFLKFEIAYNIRFESRHQFTITYLLWIATVFISVSYLYIDIYLIICKIYVI